MDPFLETPAHVVVDLIVLFTIETPYNKSLQNELHDEDFHKIISVSLLSFRMIMLILCHLCFGKSLR